jgi:DnaJ like chaperone protein
MRLSLFSQILLQAFLVFTTIACSMIITEGHWGSSISLGALALAIYHVNRVVNLNKETAYKSKYHFLEEESDYTNILIQLIAQVVSVDGKTTQKEMGYVQHVLMKYFEADRVKNLCTGIESFIAKDISNYAPICKILSQRFDSKSKIQLMHLLVGICAIDSLMTKKEEALLKDIAFEMRLPFATFQQILLMHQFKYEKDVNEKQYQKRRPKYTSQSQLKTALGILGLTESSSPSEIKKAYRKLAVKHHPDKVAHLGKEMQEVAKENFLVISDAYELIKTKKGFS